MILQTDGNDLLLKEVDCFDCAKTLDCGQAFRWREEGDSVWCGVAFGKRLRLKSDGDTVRLFDTTLDEYNTVWKAYFDFDTDYKSIISAYTDSHLMEACSKHYGIRILKQDGWEAVCSFIISANNNIPRIKGIIERLCENFGDELSGGGYAFPKAEKIAALDVDDLAVIRSGFRAKYIIDAARKISSGAVDLNKVATAPFDKAKAELLKIKGVGEKVAQCALLYGFHRLEAFPVDVWVKRIVSELYPDGLPECIKGSEGVAQQYLFHWRRNL